MMYRILSVLGVAFGGGAGLAYQHFIGCANGCPMKSSPWFMTGFGALVGLFLMQALAEVLVRGRGADAETVPEKAPDAGPSER
jgi:hypothetical protein